MSYLPLQDQIASGTITTQNSNPASGTATASSTVSLTGLNNVSVVSIQVTGTYTGALTPQVSNDGTNWVGIDLILNANTGVYTGTVPTGATGIWQAEIPAFKQFRVSANGAVTGTATVTLQAGIGSGFFPKGQTSMATSIPVAIASDQTPIKIKGDIVTQTFSVTSTGVIGPYDVSGYAWVTVQFTNTGTGPTISGQFSGDSGTTWQTPNNWWNSSVSSNATAGITVNTSTLQEAVIMGDYFRLNLTALTSGTVAGTIKFYTNPRPVRTMGVTATQAGTWTMQPGNTPNTTPWNVKTGGTSTTAVASGASSNTVIKGSAGTLCRVLVTTTGTNPMNIYDNATTNSGTIIGALPASPAVGSIYDFQMPATNGITVGGNASNPGVTISYSN